MVSLLGTAHWVDFPIPGQLTSWFRFDCLNHLWQRLELEIDVSNYMVRLGLEFELGTCEAHLFLRLGLEFRQDNSETEG